MLEWILETPPSNRGFNKPNWYGGIFKNLSDVKLFMHSSMSYLEHLGKGIEICKRKELMKEWMKWHICCSGFKLGTLSTGGYRCFVPCSARVTAVLQQHHWRWDFFSGWSAFQVLTELSLKRSKVAVPKSSGSLRTVVSCSGGGEEVANNDDQKIMIVTLF